MNPFDNILVYLDGSEGSINALMYSIMISKKTGAELHAVYVVNTKALNDLVKSNIFAPWERESYLKDLKEDAKRHIKHAVKLSLKKEVQINAFEMEGSPHIEVADYIRKNSIDLLVMGSINEIKSRREELLGENDRLLRTAGCAVLTVRDDDDIIWDKFEEL